MGTITNYSDPFEEYGDRYLSGLETTSNLVCEPEMEYGNMVPGQKEYYASVLSFGPVLEKLMELPDFGHPKPTQGFFDSLFQLEPAQKVLRVFKHLQDLDSEYHIYGQCLVYLNEKLAKTHIGNGEMYKYYEHKKNLTEKFLVDHFKHLFEYLNAAMEQVCYQFRFDKQEDNHGPILFQSPKCFELSVLCTEQTHWQKLVVNEFKHLKETGDIPVLKEKMIYRLKALDSYFGHGKIPFLINGSMSYFEKIRNEGSLVRHIFLNRFQCPNIKNRLEFVTSLGEDKLKKALFQYKMVQTMSEQLIRKSYLDSYRHSKLSPLKSVNEIRQGFLYLLKRANKNGEVSHLENVASGFVCDLFHVNGELAVQKSAAPRPNWPVSSLVDYLLFLQQKGYFALEKEMSLIQIIRTNFDHGYRGFGNSNLSKVVKEGLARCADNTLSFGGLTSAKVLRNEMRNWNRL